MSNVLRLTSHLLSRTARAWYTHDAPRMGAALAYYTTFSMAPILIIAIAVAGEFFGEQAARNQVAHQLTNLLGLAGATVAEQMLSSVYRGGSSVAATLLGIFTLLLGATSVFAELQSALNLIWEAPPHPERPLFALIRARMLSFAMVLVVGFLLLVSLIISTALAGFQDRLDALKSTAWVAQVINVGVSLVVTTGLFGLIYKILPDVKIAWHEVWVGSFVTAALFTLGKLLIGFYLGNSALASTYGAAGSFVVMLVWIYYSAQLILFGAEFTRVYAHWLGERAKQVASSPV